MIWFDSHAHLQDADFDSDYSDVLRRAREAGVDMILLPGSDLADSTKALCLANRHDFIRCSAGCHPHAASGFGQDGISRLRELIDADPGRKIVAIGETGLDYHYDFSPRSVQQTVFKQQLDLAFASNLPLIIHEREATADCLAILARQAASGRLRASPGVFHCFSGSRETAAALLKMGFYIGVDGPITFKNARKTIEVINACPHDRLLLETDSPYLTPAPYRGRRNEPAYLPLIGRTVAEIWRLPVEEVARLTTANACRLFSC